MPADRELGAHEWLARPAVAVFVRCALVAGAIKGVLLLIDHTPRYFFGDSGVYIATDLDRPVDAARSWLYGVSINPLTDTFDSLAPILVVQSACGVVICAVIGTLAVVVFDCARRTALVLAALLAVEPLSLWYERSIMAELPGTLAWVLSITLALQVVRRPRPAAGVASSVAATLAVALRSAFSAPVAALGVLCIGLALGHLLRRERRRALGVAALPLSLGLLLGAYANLNGSVTDTAASLNPRSGYFLVGVTAPIIEADDLADVGFADAARVLEESGAARREERNEQVFAPQGLMPQLEALLGDADEADEAASAIVGRAVRRDPIGFVGLLVRQAADYADPRSAGEDFETWAGLNRPIDPAIQAILHERMEYMPPADGPSRGSLTRTWLSATTWWSAFSYVATVLASLASLLFARRMAGDGADAALRLVAAVTLVYVASTVALSVEVIPRYLLPALPLMALQLAVLARGASSWRQPIGHRRDRSAPGRSGSEPRWTTSPPWCETRRPA